jgi:membrane protein implicated in regulation of membrane protease activity
MVIEFFLICWGLTGFWSVENLVHTPHPNLFQMLPILALAFGGGWLGSRGAAEIIGRVLPHEESTVVSGDTLYGLTGKVAFPVSEKSGRVHIYDEFGTLHDEMCRVPDGHPLITRGSTVRIVDRDMASGRLIVEETAPPTSMANQ